MRSKYQTFENLSLLFEEPGFEDLYATWSEILYPDNQGEYVEVDDGLDMASQAENAVMELWGYPRDYVIRISKNACRAARIVPHLISINILEIYDEEEARKS